MWARISGSDLLETIPIPKGMTINNIQYPKSIFGKSWTNAERKDIGIVPYEFEGSLIENMFYTSSEGTPTVESDRVVIKRSQTAKNIDAIKSEMKNRINISLGNFLSESDWIIIRKADTGEDGPSDLVKWRSDLRAKASALESSVDSKSDVASLEAMTVRTQAQVDANENAEFYDWPKNPRAID